MSTASWTTQREPLAVDAIRRTGRVCLRVRGESMLPTIWPGDEAEIEACSIEDVGRGDIAFAFRDGRLFLHRFMANCGGGFLARGDSMASADPAYPADALLGKLVQLTRSGKVVGPNRLRAWRRVLGLLCCHSARVRQFVLRFHQPGHSMARSGFRGGSFTTDVHPGEVL